jgi:very-short-patch-repair endonuclease
MIKNGNEIQITNEESKICKLDNKKFDSNRKMIWYVRKNYHLTFEDYIIKSYYNGIRPVCLKTGNPLKFKANKLGSWFSNWSQNAFPRIPHSEKTKQKIKEGCEKTALAKYGVKNVFSTEWCKKKIKTSLMEKYGVDNIMKLSDMKLLFSEFSKSQETIEKTKKTNCLHFGVDHFFKTREYKLSLRKNFISKFYKNWDEYKNKLSQNEHIKCLSEPNCIKLDQPATFQCKLCNHIWKEDTIMVPECPKCREEFRNSRSKQEASLLIWLSSTISDPIMSNKRFNINGKIYEADVCIESKKLIIELHGLFWHGELHGKKDRKYHLSKYNAFRSIGYDIIQIFEDEWLFKTDIIKQKILHKLGYNNSPKLYARKCFIKKIDYNICKEFLDKTHIQGNSVSSIQLGAYYEDELVAVMTFSNLRKFMGGDGTQKDIYELVRFSTSINKIVIGIAGKLMNYFINNYNPSKIVSYADRRWTNEHKNLYLNLKMNLVRITEPNYWYVKKVKREHRFKYRKSRLIKMGADPLKTEWESMKSMGYDRIWDCGNLKFELNC